MTPGDPRIANVVVLGFASLMSWLLWRFALRHLTTVADVGRTVPFFVVFGFFLLVNALWCASAGTLWARLAQQAPVVTRSGLEDQRNQDQILLAGSVGKANRSDQRGVVYYVDDGVLAGPLELMVEIQGSEATITGMDLASRWNWDSEFAVGRVLRSRLRVGQSVVVWGTVEHGRPMAQSQTAPSVSVRAKLVFCGTAADFIERARAQGARPYPRVLAWLSLAAALVAIGTPFVHWRRIRSAAPRRAAGN